MEIQSSFASQLYDSARKLAQAPSEDPVKAGSPELRSFAETMAEAAQDLVGTIRQGEAAAMKSVSGGGDVQSVVEALTATELALQTAVTVRDRVVEAYQEVLRMPI